MGPLELGLLLCVVVPLGLACWALYAVARWAHTARRTALGKGAQRDATMDQKRRAS